MIKIFYVSRSSFLNRQGIRSSVYILEGEFLKRFALFPFFFRHGQTRYDAHLQDDANCNLRESEYKRDEETLLLKTFALSGRNV